jgi:hypothetical protein
MDLPATTLNVLIEIWEIDFFSKGQIWAISERILTDSKSAAKILILATLQNSEDAQ